MLALIAGLTLSGWAIGLGFAFTLLGGFVQLSHSEQKLQRFEEVGRQFMFVCEIA